MKRSLGVVLACCTLLSSTGCKKKSREAEAAAAHGASLGAMASGATPHVATLEAEPEAVFGARGSGVAWLVGVGDATVVVHDGREGKPYAQVSDVTLSPDGRRVAYGALVAAKWRVVVDDREGPPFDAVRAPVFSPDGRHVAYLARAGEVWSVVVDGVARAPMKRAGAQPLFDARSSRIVFFDGVDALGWGRLVISDLAFKKETVVEERASALAVDPAQRWIAAATASAGGRRVVVVDLEGREAPRRGPERDDVRQLVLGPGGHIAYLAERAQKVSVFLDDREAPVTPGEQPVTSPVVRPDGGAVGIFVLAQGAVTLRQYFAGAAAVETGWDAAEALAYSADGRSHAYVAEKNGKWFVVVDGKPGMALDRAVTPAFSRDGARLVYRARTAGRRFVVVADATGKTLSLHPSYEQVYPVWFKADGKGIAYGVRQDGKYTWRDERL